jgi:iron complex transport system substrate-binding protein
MIRATSGRRILFGLALSLALGLAGCGAGGGNEKSAASVVSASEGSDAPSSAAAADSGAKETRTLTDAAGHEVEVPAKPQRIIAPFLEDPLTALGVKPVAQWAASGVPQQYLQDKLKDVPLLNMMNGLVPEDAFSHEPDLIVLPSGNYLKAATYEDFSKVAPTFVLSQDTNDWRGSLTKLGDLLGKSEEAKAALDAYDRKLEEARTSLRTAVGEKTAVLLQPNGDKDFKLFGEHFYSGALLYDGLGFKPPKLLGGDYDTYSMETLAQLDDVDYLFVLSGRGRPQPPTDNPLWKSLPAVKQGHVFEADSGHWFNQNVIANGLIIDDVLRDIVPSNG